MIDNEARVDVEQASKKEEIIDMARVRMAAGQWDEKCSMFVRVITSIILLASRWSTTALGGWFFPLLVWFLTLGFRSRKSRKRTVDGGGLGGEEARVDIGC